jgi:alpha-L-arabinofuranosidase
MLYNDDLKITNSAEKENVTPVNVEISDVKSKEHKVTLKKHSFNMIVYKY